MRSPAPAEPCDSTLLCHHNSDVTHDNMFLRNIIFSAPSLRVLSAEFPLRGDTDPPGPTSPGRHHWRVRDTETGLRTAEARAHSTELPNEHNTGPVLTLQKPAAQEEVQASEGSGEGCRSHQQTGAFSNKSVWTEVRRSAQVGSASWRIHLSGLQHHLWLTLTALRSQTALPST